MRQLTKTQSIIMLAGGMLMVVCSAVIMATALMPVAQWTVYAVHIAPWAFLIGTVAYVAMQQCQAYRGDNITLRRLTAIQTLSGVCFIVAGLLMTEQYTSLVQPLFVSDLKSYFLYVRIVHNNWVVLVLIGAIIQMYTTHRITSEMNKLS